MRRLLPLISAFMLVLVLWTGTSAHAAEAMDCAEVTTSEAGHFEGDGDEVPGDSDQATPHHHSACHGHCIAVPSGLTSLICIPVEELEAWFWSDPAIVEEIGRGKGKAHPSPHLIAKPKEALIRLSMAGDKKPRYSTNDNPRLAEKLALDVCAGRCRAFRELRDLVHAILRA